MATITSANSVFMLGASPLYPVAQQIQGYAADDAFTIEETEMAEVRMGVDGFLAGGYTPYPIPLSFTLQANSESNIIMDLIMDYQDSQIEVINFFASFSIPSLGMIYDMQNGYLVKGSPMASAKKVMEARKFSITFNNIMRVPI